jgi:poly-gamma-glutamate synthesis protein (capsule biosynthesis protein)
MTGSVTSNTSSSITFLAAGDNLIHAAVYRAAATSGGGFDFAALYQPVAPLVAQADIAFVSQETVCGGVKLGLHDYPQFNSPLEVIDALADTGFNWIGTASNHVLDRGPVAIRAQLQRIAADPRLTSTGTHACRSDAQQPTLLNVKGLRVGLASYSYGLNGYSLPTGQEYLVDLLDRDRVVKDLTELATVSDIMTVSVHWGVEYSSAVSDEQREWAQLFADLGVDVVIGTHPHVVQPVKFITGKNGNQTLVFYSLGNFLSAQNQLPCVLGALGTWTINYDARTDAKQLCDVRIRPIVTHIETEFSSFRTYLLHDYPDELARQHALASDGLTVDVLEDMAYAAFGKPQTLPYSTSTSSISKVRFLPASSWFMSKVAAPSSTLTTLTRAIWPSSIGKMMNWPTGSCSALGMYSSGTFSTRLS